MSKVFERWRWCQRWLCTAWLFNIYYIMMRLRLLWDLDISFMSRYDTHECLYQHCQSGSPGAFELGYHTQMMMREYKEKDKGSAARWPPLLLPLKGSGKAHSVVSPIYQNYGRKVLSLLLSASMLLASKLTHYCTAFCILQHSLCLYPRADNT